MLFNTFDLYRDRRPSSIQLISSECTCSTRMCQHTPTHPLSQSHTLTLTGSVSEGMSSSTFPLHQSLLYAASASAGLPGLAAARDLLTCSFVAELACLRVCIRSPSHLHAWTNGFIVCFEFRIGRWAARAPLLSERVRVVIHMLFHEGFLFFFF